MSFENFPPERDGAAAIPTINWSYGLNTVKSTVDQPGRVVSDWPHVAVTDADRNAGQ